jgi:hypothetical protein
VIKSKIGTFRERCKAKQSNALDVVLVGAVGLQGIASVGEVLVGDEHRQGDAESEGCHDKQHLKKKGGGGSGRVRGCSGARIA